jgi:hypothetical protein
MKKLIITTILLALLFSNSICSAVNMIPEMTQALETCSDLQLELKSLKYKRRILLTEFLKKHTGEDFVAKNPTL